SFAAAGNTAPLPALILAVGFALRRHVQLVASSAFEAILAVGLAGDPTVSGYEMLATRSLEVLASLCEHLSAEAG
ncbi:unnamed protein product, partial [Symbiodinium microadriaticum]